MIYLITPNGVTEHPDDMERAIRLDAEIWNRDNAEKRAVFGPAESLPENHKLDGDEYRPMTRSERAAAGQTAEVVAELKAEKLAQVDALRSATQSAATVTHTTGEYSCSGASVQNVTGLHALMVAGLSVPGGAKLTTVDSERVAVTQQDVLEIAGLMAAKVDAIYAAAATHKKAIQAKSSVSTLENYNLEAGWP